MSDFPYFTRDQFAETEEPYRYLLSLKDTPFKQRQARARLNDNAKAVGYTGFVGTYNEFAKEMVVTGEVVANLTEFSTPPNDLALSCGDWSCDDFGISKRNMVNGEDIACTHPILPIERLVNADTNVEKMKIAFRRGYESWREIIVEKEVLFNKSKIITLANSGVLVTSENAKYLVEYMHDLDNLNYDAIPKRESISRLGWINDDFAPFMEDLEFDGQQSFQHMYESVQQVGNFEEWLNLAKEIRKTDSVARIMLAASFASPLIKPLNKLNFMVHLWGGTEVGKTVALMFATSVWANPSPGGDSGYIQTFNGTQVALELQSSFVNNLPLVLDEFQLVRDKKTFDQMVYMLCEGIGKMRGAKTGGLQKTTTWKNCTITSGETPISSDSSGGGAVNRIIEIECQERIFQDPQTVAETVSSNYGFAGKKFIDILASRIKADYSEIIKEFKYFYRELVKHTTEKQAMAGAMILIADELATEWIFEDSNALEVEDILPYMHKKETVDVNRRAYMYLLDQIDANRQRFDEQNVNESWGSIDSAGYINVIPSVFNRLVEEGHFNPAALKSWLKINGFLRTDNDKGRFTKKCRFEGKTKRMISFVSDPIFDDDFEEVGEEELPY